MAQRSTDVLRRLLVERLGPVGARLREGEPMARHTTLQIGGPADWFFEAAHAEDVPKALDAAAEAGLPVFVLGGGSNLLVSDEGVRGLVLHVACDAVRFDQDAAIATVESGRDFLEFIELCKERERSALEFAAGVSRSLLCTSTCVWARFSRDSRYSNSNHAVSTVTTSPPPLGASTPSTTYSPIEWP